MAEVPDLLMVTRVMVADQVHPLATRVMAAEADLHLVTGKIKVVVMVEAVVVQEVVAHKVDGRMMNILATSVA